jgi:NitT/TauT family transport system ATP-binding protein
VLSAHPGQIQELIEVPVPRPRSIAQIVSAPFLATKARLEELIYSARHDPADEEEYPIMGRMTNVADNVE